jgi:hypothetical protein
VHNSTEPLAADERGKLTAQKVCRNKGKDRFEEAEYAFDESAIGIDQNQ